MATPFWRTDARGGMRNVVRDYALSPTTPFSVLEKAFEQASWRAQPPDLEFKYEDGCKAALTRPPPGVPNWITPQVSAADPAFLRYMIALANGAGENWKAEGLNGFTLGGVPSDFSVLRTVSGVSGLPLNLPPKDNAGLCEELGLRVGFASERDRRIYEALYSLLYGEAHEADMRLQRPSTTSFPFCTRDMEYKIDAFLAIMNRLGRVIKYLEKGDLYGAYDYCGLIFIFTLYGRLQQDPFVMKDGQMAPKERWVHILDKEEGRLRIKADKLGPLRNIGITTEGVAAMRHRVVYGAAFLMMAVTSCVEQQFRPAVAERFGFALHHSTNAVLLDKLVRFDAAFIRGIDVTQHDESEPRWFLTKVNESHEANFGPLALFFKYQIFAPWVAGPRSPGGKAFAVASPFDASCSVCPGLPSGSGDNPGRGMIWMAFVYLTLIDGMTGDLLEFAGDDKASIAAFLRGEHPDVALLMKTDDALLAGKRNGRFNAEQFDALLASGSPYAKLGPEPFGVYLGGVSVGDRTGLLRSFVPNVVTMLKNELCPEHGVDADKRTHWAMGILLRWEHYKQAPLATEVRAYADELWARHMPDVATPYSIASSEKEARVQVKDAVTEIDIEVMAEPSKATWKYLPEEISPKVREKIMATVRFDKFGRYLSPFMSHLWRTSHAQL